MLIINSCEDPQEEILSSSIEFLAPSENFECEDSPCEIEIVVKITNKEEADAAHILANNQIIATGLSDTIITYYNIPPLENQSIDLKAILGYYETEDTIFKQLDSDEITISDLNYTDTVELDANIVKSNPKGGII